MGIAISCPGPWLFLGLLAWLALRRSHQARIRPSSETAPKCPITQDGVGRGCTMHVPPHSMNV